MRIDLEFIITGQLTNVGLNKVSELFFGESKSIIPANWDSSFTLSGIVKNTGNLIPKTRPKTTNIHGWLYVSGIDIDNPVELDYFASREGTITPIFKAGSLFFNNLHTTWSFDRQNGQFNYDADIEYFKLVVDNDIDISTAKIHTMALMFPGYVIISKSFNFVSYDGISLTTTFRKSKDNYKWTLIFDETTNKSTIYLEKFKADYSNVKIGSIKAKSSGIIALGDFPADLDSFQIHNLKIEHQYTISNGILFFNNNDLEDFDVYVSYSVLPVIEYRKNNRVNIIESVHKDINMTPTALRFKNGALCAHGFYGAAGGTILTDSGNQIILPSKLTVEIEKNEIEILDATRVFAYLTGFDDMPIKDAKIRFEFSGSSDDSLIFVENNSKTYSSNTGIDGIASSTILSNRTRFGWYLQKQWVLGNRIYLPFDIGTDNHSEIYLYLITGDDPIMGKLFATHEEQKLFDNYTQQGDLESYDMSRARKIAYIELQKYTYKNQDIVRTAYIKPKSIKRHEPVTIWVKNLFIAGTNSTLFDWISLNNGKISDMISVIQGYPDVSYQSFLGWDLSKLPIHKEPVPLGTGTIIYDNIIRMARVHTNNGTIIEYDNNIPNNSNVIGFWLITGSGADNKIKAIFEDKRNFIYFESDPIDIKLANFVKSEQEFTLSDTFVENVNTQLRDFGYYNALEFNTNMFGINACTYTCKYSNPIARTCSKELYTTFFIEDPTYGGCLQPTDENIVPRCPIRNCKYSLTEMDVNGIVISGRCSYNAVNDKVFIDENGNESFYFKPDSFFNCQQPFDETIPDYQRCPNVMYIEKPWGYVNPFLMKPEVI